MILKSRESANLRRSLSAVVDGPSRDCRDTQFKFYEFMRKYNQLTSRHCKVLDVPDDQSPSGETMQKTCMQKT